MTDNVNHPAHYQVGGYEVYDILNAFFPDDPLGWQVGKYLLRFKRKNGAEDVRKMLWFGEKLALREEAAEQLAVTEQVLDAGAPRVWNSRRDIPDDVELVVDRQGDHWTQGDEVCCKDDQYAPFTEVIEPRVFESWKDIPEDVTAVREKDGNVAYRIGRGWLYAATRAEADSYDEGWEWSDDYDDDDYAPFTEVIE